MDHNTLTKILELHKKWLKCNSDGERADLSSADLSSADLRYTNLCYADLCSANLSFANLDFSCLPLCCGSKDMIVDIKIAYQVAAHLCVLSVQNKDGSQNKEFLKIREMIISFAQKSHRANDLKLI